MPTQPQTYVVQILLPLYDNKGSHLPGDPFARVRAELTERFGGLTAYTRAPAEGLWKDSREHTNHDEIVIFEVMAKGLDRRWWRAYRRKLEKLFRQETLIIRADKTQLL